MDAKAAKRGEKDEKDDKAGKRYWETTSSVMAELPNPAQPMAVQTADIYISLGSG